MNPPPKVSVILTSYNHAKYLRDAIDSVLAQTFSDFEIIIWDDASMDESWEIINDYLDPRIRAFRNETNLRFGNVNRALEQAVGEYIAIHHSDDVWEADKLKKQVAFLNENSQVGAVFSNAFIIGENGERFEDASHFYYNIFEQPNRSRHEWLNYFFYKGNALCHPSVLIRKACYDDCGLYRYGFAQLADFDMWVRLCLRYEIYVLPEKLVRFRVRENKMNTSASRPDASIRHLFETFLIYDNFRKIRTPQEFLKIFPIAQKYFTHKDYDLGFALGMMALDANASNAQKLFGLKMIFEALSNPGNAKKIKELYGFTYNDFIILTGKYDVFATVALPDLSRQLAERDAQLAERDAQLAERDAQLAERDQQLAERDAQLAVKERELSEIYRSKAWQAGRLLRRIRMWLSPPGSWRARLLKRLVAVLLFPITTRQTLKNLDLIRSSDLFDAAWYLEQNSDVLQSDVEPARHYLLSGGFEGRDPSSRFSSRWYMATYPDVRAAGINPLAHYLLYGGREGRIGKEGGEGSLNLMGGNTRGFTIYKLFRLVNKTTIKKSIVYIRKYGLKIFIKKAKSIIKKGELHGVNLYENWIYKNEPEEVDLLIQKKIKFKYQPKISIVVPVWNTPLPILDEMIASVINQTYSNWELCIADGDSNPVTRARLKEWAAGEKRIKQQFLDENLGIVGNSNAALSQAQGEFIAFLDHDDTLAPFALFEVVQSLQSHTESDVIYSDEDKLDEHNKRFDAFFKPDFSPDYLHSVNYMPHFLVVRKSLGDEIGWFREGCEGAQDYDLILRAVEKARFVAHIPKILYHWRVWSESTAGGAEVKPYANRSGKKVLQEHLERIGQLAQVEDGYASTFYRVHYQHPNTPLISIIIPTHDHAEDLKRCIDSILQKTSYPNFEIILVENGSKEPETFNLYEQFKQDIRIHIIKWEQPFNYSHINNWAVTQANGEVILFLNNDTQVINGDWLEEMLQFVIRPDVGVVGAKLYYPDESIQHAGVIVGLGGVAGHSHKYYPRQHPGYFGRLVSVQNVSAVTAACLMVRKQIFQEVNGFDETYALAFGDVDLCLNILQKGYLNVWTPYAELYHLESKTRGNEDTPEKRKRFTREASYFKRKWAGWLEKGDLYYSPNLTLDHEDFRLKE
jgi:glycosyltransferase involved in cell wall biosynthesis